jgi:hypothetical protein
MKWLQHVQLVKRVQSSSSFNDIQKNHERELGTMSSWSFFYCYFTAWYYDDINNCLPCNCTRFLVTCLLVKLTKRPHDSPERVWPQANSLHSPILYTKVLHRYWTMLNIRIELVLNINFTLSWNIILQSSDPSLRWHQNLILFWFT